MKGLTPKTKLFEFSSDYIIFDYVLSKIIVNEVGQTSTPTAF